MLCREGYEDADVYSVLWFNLGTHHLPTTADIPVTVMSTSASSVMFIPFNYFNHDRSREFAAGKMIKKEPPPKFEFVNGIEQQVLQQYPGTQRSIPQAWPPRY